MNVKKTEIFHAENIIENSSLDSQIKMKNDGTLIVMRQIIEK